MFCQILLKGPCILHHFSTDLVKYDVHCDVCAMTPDKSLAEKGPNIDITY